MLVLTTQLVESDLGLRVRRRLRANAVDLGPGCRGGRLGVGDQTVDARLGLLKAGRGGAVDRTGKLLGDFVGDAGGPLGVGIRRGNLQQQRFAHGACRDVLGQGLGRVRRAQARRGLAQHRVGDGEFLVGRGQRLPGVDVGDDVRVRPRGEVDLERRRGAVERLLAGSGEIGRAGAEERDDEEQPPPAPRVLDEMLEV